MFMSAGPPPPLPPRGAHEPPDDQPDGCPPWFLIGSVASGVVILLAAALTAWAIHRASQPSAGDPEMTCGEPVSSWPDRVSIGERREALDAAVSAVTTLSTYDSGTARRHLDRHAALVTEEFAEDMGPQWEDIADHVIRSEVTAIGRSRGAGLVGITPTEAEALVLLDQSLSSRHQRPKTKRTYVDVLVVRDGDRWLVDDLAIGTESSGPIEPSVVETDDDRRATLDVAREFADALVNIDYGPGAESVDRLLAVMTDGFADHFRDEAAGSREFREQTGEKTTGEVLAVGLTSFTTRCAGRPGGHAQPHHPRDGDRRRGREAVSRPPTSGAPAR